MMTRDVANRYNFTILPSDIQIKSANNAVTAVVGVTAALTIDINGHTCQISFIVLEHDDHEILLGLDWFRLTGASLHPSDRVLNFPGTTVSLLNDISSTADTDISTMMFLSYPPQFLMKTILMPILTGSLKIKLICRLLKHFLQIK